MAKIKMPRPPWIADIHPAFKRESETRGNASDMAGEYDSKWRRYSLQFLAKNPICCKCDALATVTDHIIPLRQGGSKYDTRNHQPMCNRHHAIKSGDEGRGIYEEKVGGKYGYIPKRNAHLPAVLGNESWMTNGGDDGWGAKL